MAQASERIAQRIVHAFKARALSPSDPIFLSYSSEVDTQTVEGLARQSNWPDFPQDVLRANSVALAFMTPEAFAWFLPACMLMSVMQYDENRALTSIIITALTPPDKADSLEFESLEDDIRALDPDALIEEPSPGSLYADDELMEYFEKRFAGLSSDEKAAIRDYLEYIDTAHGDDFPVFGPKQALGRYWAKGAWSTGEQS